MRVVCTYLQARYNTCLSGGKGKEGEGEKMMVFFRLVDCSNAAERCDMSMARLKSLKGKEILLK